MSGQAGDASAVGCRFPNSRYSRGGRQQGRRRQVPLADEIAPAPGEADAMIDRTLLKQEVLRCLEAVPEGPREALVMHYLVGLTPAEAAMRLGLSRAAFDTRLSRGREALRKEMTLIVNEAFQETGRQAADYLRGIAERVRVALGRERRDRVSAGRELALLAIGPLS